MYLQKDTTSAKEVVWDWLCKCKTNPIIMCEQFALTYVACSELHCLWVSNWPVSIAMNNVVILRSAQRDGCVVDGSGGSSSFLPAQARYIDQYTQGYRVDPVVFSLKNSSMFCSFRVKTAQLAAWVQTSSVKGKACRA